MNILYAILDTAANLPWTQWVAFITGLVYVILAAREQLSCWLFGILSCAFIAWDDFTQYLLYADGVLQIFYILIGFYGLYKWQAGGNAQGSLKISEKPIRFHLFAIALGVAISWPVGILLNTFSNAAYAFADSLTTVFSLFATYLLVNKVRSNWLYWIIIDLVYCFLFFAREGYLISLLYGIFCLVAVFGFVNWRKEMPDR